MGPPHAALHMVRVCVGGGGSLDATLAGGSDAVAEGAAASSAAQSRSCKKKPARACITYALRPRSRPARNGAVPRAPPNPQPHTSTHCVATHPAARPRDADRLGAPQGVAGRAAAGRRVCGGKLPRAQPQGGDRGPAVGRGSPGAAARPPRARAGLLSPWHRCSLLAPPLGALSRSWSPACSQLPSACSLPPETRSTRALKPLPSRRSFNLRVVECRLAAALLARKLGAAPEAAAAVRTLREVEPAVSASYGPGLEGQVGRRPPTLAGHGRRHAGRRRPTSADTSWWSNARLPWAQPLR